MSDARRSLDLLVDTAMASHPGEPEIARRSLLELAAMADEDIREEWALAYARDVFDQRVRNATLRVERGSVSDQSREPTPGTKAWGRWANRNINKERAKVNREEHERLSAEYERIDKEAMLGLVSDLTSAMEKYRESIRIEWTRELLDSSFAMGDGTFVTWGDATRENHEARIEMHRANAQAGLEGWARHAAAIDAITAAGASCLNDIEGKVAA